MAEGIPLWMIFVGVVVPLVILSLILAVVYYCYRRLRLNWFDKNLLEESDVESHEPNKETTCINRSSSIGYGIKKRDSKPYIPMLSPSYLTKESQASLSSDTSEGDRFWIPPDLSKRRRSSTLALEKAMKSPRRLSSSSLISTKEMQADAEEFADDPGDDTLSQDEISPIQNRRRRSSMQDPIDITTFDTKLYERMINKEKTLEFDNIPEENLGSINVVLSYNPETSLLSVNIVEARDLVNRDVTQNLDPYCKVLLVPTSTQQLTTKVVENTSNPHFNEELMFAISSEFIRSKNLEILVYDKVRYSQDECIGKCIISLSTIHFVEDVSLWETLKQYERKTKITFGEVMFSLSYLPAAERLTVVILKARNLQTVEDTVPETHTRISITHEDHILKKKKTTTITDRNPVWNQALVLGINKDVLVDSILEVMVVDDSLLGHKEIIGKAELSAHSEGEYLKQWQDMIEGRTAGIPWWHSLSN